MAQPVVFISLFQILVFIHFDFMLLSLVHFKNRADIQPARASCTLCSTHTDHTRQNRDSTPNEPAPSREILVPGHFS